MNTALQRLGLPPKGPRKTPIAATAIHEHLLVARDGTWAWFALTPQPYYFRTPADRDAQRVRLANRLTALRGHRIHLRVTEHPYAAPTWAKAYDKATRATRVPDHGPGETFNDMLVAMQQRAAALGLTIPTTYLGVRITSTRLRKRDLPGIIAASAKHKNIAEEYRRIRAAVTAEGLAGQPIGARALAWLIASSLTPGMPITPDSLAAAQAGWDDDDVEEFTAAVNATAEPYDPDVTITAVRGGKERTVHATVVTMSRAPKHDITDLRAGPLFQWPQSLPFPVQWSWVADVVDGSAYAKKAEKVRRDLEDEIDLTVKTGRMVPLSREALRDTAARVEDERTSVDPDTRLRLVGQVRALVHGATREEALANAATLISEATNTQGALFTTHPGQWHCYREFVPGEPAADHGYVRKIPGQLASAWGPAVETRVGDNRGPYRGYTTRRAATPFHLDMQDGPACGHSGFQVIMGTLGHGKTLLAGQTVELEVRAGHLVGVLDPSGRMKDLLKLPWMRGVRDLDLTSVASGAFIPWRQVPDPVIDDFLLPESGFPNAAAYTEHVTHAGELLKRAYADADEERRNLAVEMFLSRLPAQIVQDSADARHIIRTAVNEVGGDYATDPWAAVAEIERQGGNAAFYARIITESADALGGRAFLPPTYWREPARSALEENVIITARNLPMPAPGTARRDFSESEQYASGLLRAAAWYLARMIYTSGQDPKLVDLEELGDIGESEAIRGLAVRSSFHTRKSNSAVLASIQNPKRFLKIDEEIGNLLGNKFLGRMGSRDAAVAALQVAGIPEVYAPVLLTLEVGEFLVVDHHGRAATVQFDSEYRPHVHALLRTNPPASADTVDPTGINDTPARPPAEVYA